jgi:hypothetical protein
VNIICRSSLNNLWAFKLGRWKHAHEIETSEDILANPASIPYTNEVDDILSPFKKILTNLLNCKPKDLKNETIPARLWLESTNRPLLSTLVPYVGSLSLEERAQIANWFDCHITHNDKKLRLSWLGYLPLAHAYTLFIAHRLKSDPKMKKLKIKDLLLRAWEVQFTGTPERLVDIDIERDCLEQLEEEMFEVSIRAGIAGNYQWGLDSGYHDDWNPYAQLPAGWNVADYVGDDEELEV